MVEFVILSFLFLSFFPFFLKKQELIDVVIESKAALFVCAVGIPPKWVVDRLHAAKILVMNSVKAKVVHNHV